jgi:hypothetical protein
VAACVGATALAAALGLAATPGASALWESRFYLSEPGDHWAKAACPKDMHVISGGGKSGFIRPTGRRAAISSSHKSGNGWIVGGYSFHDHATVPSHNFRVTAYAYCSRHNFRLRTYEAESAGTPRTSTAARCEKGNLVSGGGWVDAPYGVPFLNAKRRNGWKFGADATADGGPGRSTEVEAAAYCTPRPYRLRRARATSRVGAHRSKAKTAHCPKGTRVVSGGGSAGESPSAVLWYSRKRRNGWRIKVAAGGSPTRITAYAYCR